MAVDAISAPTAIQRKRGSGDPDELPAGVTRAFRMERKKRDRRLLIEASALAKRARRFGAASIRSVSRTRHAPRV
jgi:hypothetical protein